MEDNKYEFYNLGLGEPITISASAGLGIGDMLDVITGHFEENDEDDQEQDAIRVAIIGKPNVGKSSLLNRLSGEERSIVSDIPGTTRDAIDSFVQIGEDKFIFIDTAGIRKKSKVKEDVEKYSVIRALTSIEKADVCLVMLDGDELISDQDEKIAGYAHEEGKAIVIVVNKWDKVEKDDKTMNEYEKKVKTSLSFMSYAPVVFISAKTGQRVNKMIEAIKSVYEQYTIRIKTGVLNEVINEAVMMKQPPIEKGKLLKIYYATQVAIKPPTFAVFVNYTNIIHFSYARYLENQLRQHFGLEGTPIKLLYRPKNEE
jgi:GTP-binding protein